MSSPTPNLPWVQRGRVGFVVNDCVEEGGVGVLGEAEDGDAVDGGERHGVQAGHVEEPVAADEGLAAHLKLRNSYLFNKAGRPWGTYMVLEK